jgi:hypothetical protein
VEQGRHTVSCPNACLLPLVDRVSAMIKAEVLEALPKLNAEERREIRAKLNELDSETWFDNGELSEQEKGDNRSAPGRVGA